MAGLAVRVAALALLLAGIVYLLVRHVMRSPLDVAAMRARQGPPRAAGKVIPRHIWTYWEGPESELVQACMERCRRLNPGYTLTVLGPGNVREHVPELPAELLAHPAFNDLPARKADLVRCFAIAYRGGIWVDASIICMRPFAAWLDHDAEFVGFALRRNTTLPRYPMLENWFFASRPGCRFMEEWCWEFARLAEFGSGGEYASYVLRAGVDMQRIPWYELPYLAMHCAAQRVMQQVVPPTALRISPAEDGPFAYRAAPGVQWSDSEQALAYVVEHWGELERTAPFLKLCTAQRKALRRLDPARRERFMALLRGTSEE
jgi:hypothetical protein